MSRLCNLVVELVQRPATEGPARVDVAPTGRADDRTLAWIDECFGGAWSSEAHAGSNVVARREGTPVGFATLDARGLTYAWLRGVARERDVGLFGPFGVAPEERKTGLGRVLLARALDALRERGYRRALIPAVSDERLVAYYRETVGATVVEEFDRAALQRHGRRVVVMASGNGSNFQAVAEAARSGTLPLELVALVANDEQAFCIARAQREGIGVRLAVRDRSVEKRAAYNERLLETVRLERPDMVLLLGWMHLLADSFVATFPELINLHPAFLPLEPERDDVTFPDGIATPAFRGAHAVRDALDAGSPWVGATLHRVTNETDRGPVLARRPLRVAPGEEEGALMERVHALERRVVHDGLTRWLFER